MRYYSVSDFYKQKFGCKIYKLSLDAGCTCPTRDGTKGFGGCIFCSESGSGDFAASRKLSILNQIEQAKKLVAGKNKNGKYIAYFQNFTNTYGNVDELEKKYLEAVSAPEIAGIAIATRPDCISDDILKKIAALCDKTFVSIELGLQTVNEKTVNYIRRGYENSVYDEAVRKIHNANSAIHVVTHVIFGLPGETETDMLASVRYCVHAGSDGIKISVLHILRGTDIADDYEAGKFKCLEMEKYFELVSKALEEIPPQMIIHRLTGDGAKKLLIAPLWTAQKHIVHNAMARYFDEHDVIQGKRFR